MPDYAHNKTDAEIDALERRIRREYNKAYKEVQAKAQDYFMGFEARDKAMLEKLRANEITTQEYRAWRTRQMLTGERWENLRDNLAKDLTNTDRIAADMINNKLPDTYALNYNHGVYEIEQGLQIDTNFTLYSKRTVENMMRDGSAGFMPVNLNVPKDLRWNTQKITSVMTQAVLQGKSINKIAKDLRKVTDMDKNAAQRNARTYMTGAQNSGRQTAYKHAEDNGIELKKEWLSVHDGRTRSSHVSLDGERVGIDEKFSNGCRYPADPDGAPAEVYNCRCTMIASLIGFERKDWRREQTYGGLSYDEWKEQRGLKRKPTQKEDFSTLGEKPQRPSRFDFSADGERTDEYYAAYEEYKIKRDAYNEKRDKIINEMMPKESMTVKEFESWAEKHGISIITDISEVDGRALTAFTQRMDKLSKDFPWVMESRSKLPVNEEKYRRFQFGFENTLDYIAEASHGFTFGASGKDMEFLLRTQADDVASGFRVMGDGTLNQLFDHEFGHNVYDALRLQKRNWDIDFAYDDEYSAHRKAITEDLIENVYKKNPKGISEYAKTNEDELFAEAFSSWYGGEQTEFAKAMGEFLKRWGAI